MILENYFKQHLDERPDAEALIFKDRRFTFRQYNDQADRVAAGLLELGLERGDRLGIYIPNWPEFLFTYMGAAKIGMVAVPMSWRFQPQELRFIAGNSEISALVMASGFQGMDFMANLAQVKGELPHLKHVVQLDEDRIEEGMIPWSRFLGSPGPALDRAKAEVRPDDVLIFLYTSGTTGVPKAAMLTHKNVVSYTEAETDSSGLPQDMQHTLLLNVPLNHVGGAIMGVAAGLIAGTRIVMVDTFDPEETLQLIEREKVTVFGQVPAQYALELLNPNVSKYDLSSIQVAVVSSQPCPSEMISQIQDKIGVMPQNAYGLTEVSGAITYTQPDDPVEKLLYTVGRPISNVDLAIMDGNANPLPAGEVGEISVKGDCVMKGYWNRPDEDAKVFDARGYFHTGDMGRLDEDGYLIISGRKKEMYIRGGENVYPPEVEEVIAKHPDVFIVAVVGRPDEVMGEVGRAYIWRKPGTNPTAEGMREFLSDKLARFKMPADFVFVDELPLSPIGKVKKLELYERIRAEQAGG